MKDINMQAPDGKESHGIGQDIEGPGIKGPEEGTQDPGIKGPEEGIQDLAIQSLAMIEQEQDIEGQAGYFRVLGIPSLCYAVVYTVCMFKNSSGITMPFWVAATIFYVRTVMRGLAGQEGNKDLFWEKGSRGYIGVMLLLGIATFLTDNMVIIVFDHIGFFLVLVAFLLHQCCDSSTWGFGKNLAEIASAVIGALGCMFTPFSDGSAFCKEKRMRDHRERNRTLGAVLLGIVCAVPGMVILGSLLMGADAVFSSMVLHLFTEIFSLRFPALAFQAAWMLLFGFFSSYCGIRCLARHDQGKQQVDHPRFGAAAAIAFTGMIAAMYVVFCGIQIVYLFAGNMQLPEGMTYAQYARSGFFELLTVCILNFCLVLSVKEFFVGHKLLDGILLVICACTFVMIASSAYRMYLYIGVYQLTFMRVSVLVVLVGLAILMAGVSATIFRPSFPLFRYSMAVVSVLYLGFAFSHVDHFIASYNLSHAQEYMEHMDWLYLGSMSLDAAPAVADYYAHAPRELQEQMDRSAARAREFYKKGQQDYLMFADGYEVVEQVDWYAYYMYGVYEAKEGMGIRNFNLSRYIAQRVFAGK